MPPLASPEQQFELLCEDGLQFPSAEREASRLELPGVLLDGEPALYDARIVPEIPTVIAPRADVYNALTQVRSGETLQDAGPFIQEKLTGAGLIIGFSGYGTEGYAYHTEAAGIEAIHQICDQAGLPIDAVVDGGTGYGVPGLSGMVAQAMERHAIGVVPVRGARGASPRDTLVVVDGDDFGDEAPAIGLMADVLVVMGGGPNAEKELKAAVASGGLAVIAGLKDYPPVSLVNTFDQDELFANAYEDGQLTVCGNIDELTTQITRLDLDQAHASRALRATKLYDFLQPTLAP